MNDGIPLIGMAFELRPEEYDAIAASMLRALAEDPDVAAATYDPIRRAINVTLTGKALGFLVQIVVGEDGGT